MTYIKACLLLIASLLLAAFNMPAFAQISYGFKLTSGAQISYYQEWGQKGINTYTRVGLGTFMNFPLKGNLALQPELNYLTYASALLESHTVSLPILLIYKLTPGIEIEAGPSPERDFWFDYSSTKINPYLNIGANAGVNFWFSKSWSGNLRFTYELIRTTYDDGGLFKDKGTSLHPGDPLILSSEGPEAAYRDMFVTTSIRYSFK